MPAIATVFLETVSGVMDEKEGLDGQGSSRQNFVWIFSDHPQNNMLVFPRYTTEMLTSTQAKQHHRQSTSISTSTRQPCSKQVPTIERRIGWGCCRSNFSNHVKGRLICYCDQTDTHRQLSNLKLGSLKDFFSQLLRFFGFIGAHCEVSQSAKTLP